MRMHQVRATMLWQEATPQGARQRVEKRDFGPCLDYGVAEQVLIALAGRENCLEACIVVVDPKGEKMGTINVSTMVTARLTDVGKNAMEESGEDITCMGDGPHDTIRCSLGMLMEVFGNACFCAREQDQLFVNSEIMIECEPGPAESKRTGRGEGENA